MRIINRQLKNLQKKVSFWIDQCRAPLDEMSGTSWERLSVAYPDPVEALKAIQGWQLARGLAPAVVLQSGAAH